MTTLESTTERLEEALRRLAVEAADLFEGLLATGAEMPFDLEPSDDGPLPMFSYAPLTGQFIQGHLAELRRLEAFVEVREIAGEEAAIGFLIGLWDGKSEFDVAGDRLKGAIDAVVAMIASDSDEATPAGEVIVPLIGFHMPVDEIELDGVRIVRADQVDDAPVDAIDATRSGGPREAGLPRPPDLRAGDVAPAAAVADDLRRALRTLRLFRPGAVGLHAHGWAKRSGRLGALRHRGQPPAAGRLPAHRQRGGGARELLPHADRARARASPPSTGRHPASSLAPSAPR